MKSSALALALALTVTPSLLADKGGDHHKGRGDEGRHEEKLERRGDDEHDRIEERVKIRNDKERVERRVRVRDDRVRVRDDDEERVAVARRVVPANRIVIINNDVNRLESILATAQGTTVVFPQPTVIRFGNEANVLANRIVSNVALVRRPTALSAARALRMQIRQLRAAAARGDAPAVRLHAGEALNFAVRLDGLV